MIDAVHQTLAKIPPFKKVIVGISGGSDSVALAHCMKTLGYEVALAHVNYFSRGEDSKKDEVFVRELADFWGLDIEVLHAPKIEQGNFENQARHIRYEFFESVRQKYGAKFIAVGHHKNDQIETILMHIERGAGLRGRCGMYVCKNKVIRPFFDLSKDQILNYINEHQLAYRADKTNDDVRYRRNYIRHKVVPALRQKWSDFDEKLMKWSEISKRRLKKNQRRADAWLQHNLKEDRFDRESFLNLFSGVQSEVLFKLVGFKDVYRPSIEAIIDLIESGQTGKQKTIKNTTFVIEYNKVYVADSTQLVILTPEEMELVHGEVNWGQWQIEYSGPKKIHIRSWRKGDRFHPAGMTGSKKLQDFFVDQKIPKLERHQVPIITDESGCVLSIGNYRFSKEGMNLKSVLKIKKIKSLHHEIQNSR